MKKLVGIIVVLLALNFVGVLGGFGYLMGTGALDKQKVAAIREIMFPAPTSQPTTAPTTQATTQPMFSMEAMLAEQAGRPINEQIEYLRTAFDAQMATLDRRRRELEDLQRQVELAKKATMADRAALDKSIEKLQERKEETEKLLADKGFQDSLSLYNSMPSKQVKTIFMALDDETVMRYLQAMQPRTAARIIKEFREPGELERISRVLEQMRESEAKKEADRATRAAAEAR